MGLSDDVRQIREEKQRILRRPGEERYMREALAEAEKALAIGEVPIGCVIVRRDEIIARGYNRRNADGSVLSHAELLALRQACELTGDWRLEDCVLYVTLEPCPMCAGAIVQSRIPKVVYGCANPKAGSAGSIVNLLQMSGFNHRAAVERGLMEAECSAVLQAFFHGLRGKE